MIKIGLDVMGGDYAPDVTLKGAIDAKKTWANELELVLFGKETEMRSKLQEMGGDPNQFTLVNAPDVIGMSSSPVKSFAEHPQSSMAMGFDMLRDGGIQGFCSAGNSGAMLVGAYFKVGLSRDDLRPCLISLLPIENGHDGILLDVGANADCKPEDLLDFAILGATYAENVLKIDNPKVGLLNIGEEPEKGNQLSLAAYKLLNNYKSLNFVGNIEGRDLFDGKADVVVCNGFVGNVILKLSEKFYEIALRKGGKNDPFYSKFNYEQHGGSPILGVNKPVVVGHGISSPLAIKNMIRLTKEMVETSVCEKIKKAVQHA